MVDGDKKRMTVWVDPQDRDDLKTIAASVGLATESAALRYAIRKVAREIRAEEAKAKRAAR